MSESHEIRLKRLRMRSWRRGMKEMDLILGPFSDGPLSGLGAGELDDYETLLAENDQDLYLWISQRIRGQAAGPQPLEPILRRIAEYVADRAVPRG